ncbi:ATP-dependent RNA helicase HrpA [Pseudomaricurvus alcaniphilus]|nr:ATP-dependent RNA helicase HrpA [Pseudomaricurvus alcaniphilus]
MVLTKGDFLTGSSTGSATGDEAGNRDVTEQTLQQLQQGLGAVMGRDQFRLERALGEIKKRFASGKPTGKAVDKLLADITRSAELLQRRKAALPEIHFPEALPVSARREEIAELISKHQVVVLAGETGSGKTTQLPKICLELGRGIRGMIGHTQPRRLAASTVASRIAEELNTPLGETVGYQVRFSDQTRDTSLVKLMTDGILLAEIQGDRYLSQYDTLIIDEAHERSLNIDFLLGYLKRLLPQRPDLKVIITSATIDLQRFSEHFDNAPIIEVSGRTYPVEVKYRPSLDSDEDLYTAITSTVEEILQTEKSGGHKGGDILVFLSGEAEIREAALTLRKAEFPHLEVLPLYARLSLAEQKKVFSGHRGRRVVLATNVAETSITVPGIRYVIDPGFARISRYSFRSKIQRLPIEPISQASANQRMGRCGRVSEGVCYRLYEEQDFLSRPEFTDAEILRTNLAAVILQMLNLRMGDVRHFPFVDRPDKRLLNDGFKLLEELQALDPRGKVTALGRQLMTLPVDPRLGRMVLAGARQGCLRELLIIVSGLSIQDPRERPADKRQAADEKHRRFKHDHSDFLAWINLWDYVETQRQELSQNQFSKLCKREFLSFMRLREWREIHRQLLLALKPLHLKLNPEPASYDSVHLALLTGLLGNIGNLGEDKEYLGARNRRFHIFPGSSQFKKSPKWIMAEQLLETSRVYAHQVAKIEPDWVLANAEHLVKRQQYEPHYDVKSGQVMAYERITLYGLVLVEKRRVSFGRIDPVTAREVFIRAALVEERYRGKGKFFRHNQALIAELHELEAKSRRRDILVDEEAIYRFYDERVPADIVNLAGFEHWRKTVEQEQPRLLCLERHYLMQHDASSITEAQFPAELNWQGLTFPLVYHFEPGHPEDGVSIRVPVAALHLVPEKRLEWLIPGILREKCVQLVKSLPKQWRKHFVPVPNYVDQCLAAMSPADVALTEALGFQLKRQTGVEIPAEQWQGVALEDYYRFNIQVIDDSGKVLAQGRDLARLRERYRDQLQQTLQSSDDSIEREQIVEWDFDELPAEVTLQRAGMSITAYPALLDEGTSVALRLQDNPVEAAYLSRFGVLRLALLQLGGSVKHLRKDLLKGKDLGLSVVALGKRDAVVDDMLMAAVQDCCCSGPLPRTRAEFNAALEAGRKQIGARALALEKLLLEVLVQVVAIKKTIKGSKNALAIAVAAGDIQQQLQRLIYPGFMHRTPSRWLEQYPRYLAAIQQRLDKAVMQMQKDKLWSAEVDELWQPWQQRLEKDGEAAVMSNEGLQEYRWMLEEYRVSLFAQSLKTLMPVSAKRLRKLWQEVA